MTTSVLVGRSFALLGGRPGCTAHLINWDTPTTKFLAL
jgi:hypothetical protein